MRMKTYLGATLLAIGAYTETMQAQNQRAVNQPLPTRVVANTPPTGTRVPVESLKRFDVKFDGGTPDYFIETINEQAGMEVNVIIPTEFIREELPPLDVRNVTLPQLFEAGIAASTVETNVVVRASAPGSLDRGFNRFIMSKGFRTTDPVATENSIWHFFVERPPSPPVAEYAPPRHVEVFQLGYLLEDYTINDITTAIKTAWELLDSDVEPVMKFHEETQLLVARGSEEQLAMISTLVSQLERGLQFKQHRTASKPAAPQFPKNQNSR